MFDLTSSKLLLLGIVALLVVGPKELPVLLRTIGKYVGIIRRQAADFRQQFDEAMREQELASLKAEMDTLKRDVQSTVETAGRDVESEAGAVKREIDNKIQGDAGPFSTPQPVAPPLPRYDDLMPPKPGAIETLAPGTHANGAAPKTGA
jgi:sec-independent protein translocase protein TatB